MKKLIALAVGSVISTSALASVSVDVYGDRAIKSKDAKQGVELIYGLDNGFALSAEATTDKELDLGAAWQIALSDSSYVKPSVGYVFKKGERSTATYESNLRPGGYNDTTVEFNNSDVAKVGLEFGSTFGNAFSSARLRYESNTKAYQITDQEFSSVGNFNQLVSTSTDKARSEIARVDVLVGYHFDYVTLTAKTINKNEINSKMKKINNGLDIKDERWSGELKATVTAYDGVTPYIQYTHNKAFTKNGSDDQVVKIGAKFTF